MQLISRESQKEKRQRKEQKKKNSCFGVNGLEEMNKKKLILEEGSSDLGVVFSEPFRTNGNTSCHFCQGFFLRQNLV